MAGRHTSGDMLAGVSLFDMSQVLLLDAVGLHANDVPLHAGMYTVPPEEGS